MAEGSLIVVIDAAMSFRLARMLAGFHESHPLLTFRALQDIVPANTQDIDWLQDLPSNPPHIVITRDDIFGKTAQIEAWRRGGLTVVILDSSYGNMKLHLLAASLFRWWPTIQRTIKQFPKAQAFYLPGRGVPGEILPRWVPETRRGKRVLKMTLAPPKKNNVRLTKQVRAQQGQGSLKLPRSSGGDALQSSPKSSGGHEP